jgi:hypothetical protein
MPRRPVVLAAFSPPHFEAECRGSVRELKEPSVALGDVLKLGGEDDFDDELAHRRSVDGRKCDFVEESNLDAEQRLALPFNHGAGARRTTPLQSPSRRRSKRRRSAEGLKDEGKS